jgi:hypothetical protein
MREVSNVLPTLWSRYSDAETRVHSQLNFSVAVKRSTQPFLPLFLATRCGAVVKVTFDPLIELRCRR